MSASKAASPTAWSWLLIVVLPLLVFAPALQPGHVLAPEGTQDMLPWRSTATLEERRQPSGERDTVRENLPYRVFLRRALLEDGELPWWNPHSYGGAPYAALNHTQVLYPPSWVATLLDPYTAYGALIAAHTVLAGLGMALLLRACGVGWAGACVAGLCFMFNGMFTTRHAHPQFVATGAWLPWVALGVSGLFAPGGALDLPRVPSWLWGGALVTVGSAMLVLAGHPSVYVYGAVFLVTHVLFELLGRPSDLSWAERGSRLAALVACCAAALGLTAVQWLGVLELRAFSDRAELLDTSKRTYVIKPFEAFSAVFWDLRGDPFSKTFWRPPSKKLSYAASMVFAGAVPLLLAVVGIVRGRRRGWALGAMMVVLALIIMVDPVYRFVYDWVPLFRFSYINRLTIAWMLGVAVLAGLGTDALVRGWDSRSTGLWGAAKAFGPWMLALAGMSALAYTGITWMEPFPDSPGRRETVAWGVLLGAVPWALFALAMGARALLPDAARGWWPWAIVALVAAEMAVFATHHVVLRDADRVFRSTPGIEALREAELEGPVRFAKLDPRRSKTRTAVFPANSGLVFGLDDLHGFGPMHVRHMDVLLRAVENTKRHNPWWSGPFLDEEVLDSPILDLLAVTHVLTRSPLAEDGKLPAVHGDDLPIHRNTNAMSRATFVAGWQVRPDDRAAAGTLGRGEVDVRRMTVLSEAIDDLPASRPDLRGRVAWVDRGLNHVDVVKDGPHAGFVRLAEAWYPGWEALVDGEPRPVHRVDVALQAVWVPAGRHEVTFRYRPSYLPLSRVLGGAAVVLVLVLTALGAWLAARERSGRGGSA